MRCVFDPPEVFRAMEGEILSFDGAREMIEVRFPVMGQYRNPMGGMQGGVVVAAMDNTFGPLTVLLGTTSVTTHLNTTFIRPIGPGETHITITARVTARTRRSIHMTAEVVDSSGTLAVIGTASFRVVSSHGPGGAV